MLLHEIHRRNQILLIVIVQTLNYVYVPYDIFCVDFNRPLRKRGTNPYRYAPNSQKRDGQFHRLRNAAEMITMSREILSS